MDAETQWSIDNQNYLMQGFSRIETLLKAYETTRKTPDSVFPLPPSGLDPFSSIEQLCHIFGLNEFERDIILLCAGVELNRKWGELIAKIQGDQQAILPTFGLVLSVFPSQHWSAISPLSNLRKWKLIELINGKTLALTSLRIDERILHFICGLQGIDERLLGMIEPNLPFVPLVDSHSNMIQFITELWTTSPSEDLPVIQLLGEDRITKRSIAVSVANHFQFNHYVISGETLPSDPAQSYVVHCLWKRECLLRPSILILDCDTFSAEDQQKENNLVRFLDHVNCPLIILAQDRRSSRYKSLVTYDIESPTTAEQKYLWKKTLPPQYGGLNQEVDRIVSQFNLSSPAIRSIALKTVSIAQNDHRPFFDLLWETCRLQARPKLDDLAERINANSVWEDLILPDKEKEILQDIAIHVKNKQKVYEQWGMGSKNGRGLGITALFSGQSGTGKTLSAEVLGNYLKLDVYRIDLSSVVSKYIGETEKNLKRIFDCAEGGGVILLFDEADALFGKRSDVKDSHDRYANMEVSYLLQRMESYQGLAILTTNLKSSIDQAFLRRLRFVVQFPFPDKVQREEIWKRSFSAKIPTQDLDYRKLANLSVAGGNIKNIALNCAFLAAEDDQPVQMRHILQAAKSEYIKLEKPNIDNETKGWI